MTIRGAAGPNAPFFDDQARRYDAVLVVSFGGPEGPEDVLPFLENVTRGRNIPRARLEEVAHHYARFGGVSPLNSQNRALIAALSAELAAHGLELPVYFGNRNWRPYLTDAVREMSAAGVRRAVAFVSSAFSSYAGCRQYREDVIRALDAAGPGAPEVDKLRVFYNHPRFIAANADHLRQAVAALAPPQRARAHVVFTAHSIPRAMARTAGYERQLADAAWLVAAAAGAATYSLAYQSRSGPPQVPWLGPDILERLPRIAAEGASAVVVHPLGFISDHIEVLYDLDLEAKAKAAELGLPFARAATAGTSPEFPKMIRELIVERMTGGTARAALGEQGAWH
ncbi:MAG TPA: ferrochelatase, partial [Gemmatimonadales bacterium]|nr:ferrochelatase [Gemmatimonadales bacterium]